MYETTYYSTAKQNIKTADIQQILEKSRSFNSKNKITGCLLFYKNQFIQVLEGEKMVVKELLAKIDRDHRHYDIVILSEADKEQRTFENWTMAYRELSDDELKNINDTLFINNFLTFSVLASKPTRTIRMFWTRVEKLLTNDYTT